MKKILLIVVILATLISCGKDEFDKRYTIFSPKTASKVKKILEENEAVTKMSESTNDWQTITYENREYGYYFFLEGDSKNQSLRITAASSASCSDPIEIQAKNSTGGEIKLYYAGYPFGRFNEVGDRGKVEKILDNVMTQIEKNGYMCEIEWDKIN